MAEMGHTSPTLALRVSAPEMKRDEDDQAQLATLVIGEQAHERAKACVVPIEWTGRIVA